MAITVERLEAEIAADPAKAIAALTRLDKKLDRTARDRTATIEVDTEAGEVDLKVLAQGLLKVDKRAKRTTGSINAFYGSIRSTSRILPVLGHAFNALTIGLDIAVLSLVAPALLAAAGAATALVSAVAPAAGLLAGIPAAVGALGLAAGVTAVAFKGMGGAVKAFSDQSGTAAERAKKLAEATKGMHPAAIGFARILGTQIMPIMRQIKTSVQAGFFPGATEGLSKMIPVLSAVRDEFQYAAVVMGHFIKRLAFQVSTPEWVHFLSGQMASMTRIMDSAGTAFLGIMNVVRAVMRAFTPFAELIAGDLATGFTRLGQKMNTVTSQQSLHNFFVKAYATGKRLWALLKNLIGILWGVGKAAEPLGTWMLMHLIRFTDRLNQMVNSVEGQNKMRRFFNDLKEPIKAAGALIVAVAKAFGSIDVNKSGLAGTLNALRTQVLPPLTEFIRIINESGLGPAFAEMIGSLASAFLALTGNGSALIGFVNTLTTMLTALGDFLTAHPDVAEVIGGIAVAMGALAAVKLTVAFLAAPFVALASSAGSAAASLTAFRTAYVGASAAAAGGGMAAAAGAWSAAVAGMIASAWAWLGAWVTVIAGVLAGWLSAAAAAVVNAATIAATWIANTARAVASTVAGWAVAAAGAIASWIAMAAAAVANAVVVAVTWITQTAAAVAATIAGWVSAAARAIASWVAMAAAAVANAARVAATWIATTAAAVAATVAGWASAAARAIGSWLLMATMATAHALRVAAVWVAQTIATAATILAQWAMVVARVVAGWVLMATQALMQAARFAGAWLIAMGPVGWVIAAIVGLAIIIYKNWDKIREYTVKAWKLIWKAILDVWEDIKDWARKFGPYLLAALGPLGLLLTDSGRDLIMGLLKGIRDAAGKVLSEVAEIGKEIAGAVKGALKISSPSRVMMDIGYDAGEGLRLGLQGSGPGIASAARDLAGAAIPPIPTQRGGSVPLGAGNGGSSAGATVTVAPGAIVIHAEGATPAAVEGISSATEDALERLLREIQTGRSPVRTGIF